MHGKELVISGVTPVEAGVLAHDLQAVLDEADPLSLERELRLQTLLEALREVSADASSAADAAVVRGVLARSPEAPPPPTAAFPRLAASPAGKPRARKQGWHHREKKSGGASS